MLIKPSLAFAILSASLASCATHEEPVTAYEPPVTIAPVAPKQVVTPPPPAESTEGTIKIARSIQEACGLSSAKAHFRFNSAVVQRIDGGILSELAVCFTSGPLTNEDMALVGRADPRGEDEYNRLLGGRRGANVKTRLVKEGMSPNQILVSSRGELDATGTDEASWVQDRRVDVSLDSGS